MGLSELSHVKILLTSRLENEFLREIPQIISNNGCLDLHKEAVDADIRIYVAGRLEKSPEFAKWAAVPSVLTQIRNTIRRKSEGM